MRVMLRAKLEEKFEGLSALALFAAPESGMM
jgi:hypothetical protein